VKSKGGRGTEGKGGGNTEGRRGRSAETERGGRQGDQRKDPEKAVGRVFVILF